MPIGVYERKPRPPTVDQLARAAAIAAGENTYIASKACARGHVPTVRYVKHIACVACEEIKARAWREKNPERSVGNLVRWRRGNPEQVKIQAARSRRSRGIFPIVKIPDDVMTEKKKAWCAAWKTANPEARRVSEAKRRAIKKSSSGKYTISDVRDLFAIQKGKCAYCRISIKPKFHVDHIIPLKLGGLNDRKNIQLLCVTCNCRKSAKHPVVFARQIGLLL